MLRKKVIAFGIFAVLLAGAAGAKVEPGKSRYFKNWAVGCDNGLTCEAVTMMSEGALAGKHEEHMVSLDLKRNIGDGEALTMRLSGFDSSSDRYQLFVDEKLVDTGAINRADRTITILGKDALKVARALVLGRNTKLVDGAGQILGGITLAGSAAALRYFDTQQGFAGSRAAIATIGRRTARTKASALPVISARRINDKGAIPEASDLVALAEGSNCASARFDVTVDSVHSLGNNSGHPQALALINCGGGSYNQVSAVYLGTQNAAGKWRFERARFDYENHALDKMADVDSLPNSAWDAKTQRLSSVYKEREIGDCGFSADYVWDGSSFRLAQAREMKLCQGSMDWITIWRATVEFDR
jgi:Protein of unknown function (DUF1176)